MSEPQTSQEPREFWIDDKMSYVYRNGINAETSEIHVIEYSAYKSLQQKVSELEAENKRLKELLKEMLDDGCIDLQGSEHDFDVAIREALKGEGK